MTTGRAASERAPLSGAALAGALVRPGGFWRAVEVTGLTGSTNADLLERAAGGAPEGSVLVAEAQTAGRGRMGRAWISPPGAGLMFSVLLRPEAVPPARRGWIPLLAGVAIASAVAAVAGLDARLKWPNDVLVGDKKLAGILAEQAAGAIVVGVGLNVSTRRDELPAETATSLAIEGAARTGRQELLGAALGELERRYLAWTGGASPGDPDASGLRAGVPPLSQRHPRPAGAGGVPRRRRGPRHGAGHRHRRTAAAAGRRRPDRGERRRCRPPALSHGRRRRR